MDEKDWTLLADHGLKCSMAWKTSHGGIVGLNRVKRAAEEHSLGACVELLNSKVDHKDYQGDRTWFGVECRSWKAT